MRFKGVMTICGAVALAVVLKTPAAGQPDGKKDLPGKKRLSEPLDGRELFMAHCAACHGDDAKGNGRAAPALQKKVPDLTVLAKRNKGQFPSARVRKTIAGKGVSVGAIVHGSREMPIWGRWDLDLAKERIDNLTRYLESIQKK